MNYKYRMYDPRIGRFFAVDPLTARYPHNSPYAFSENVVVNSVELEGLEQIQSYKPEWRPKPVLETGKVDDKKCFPGAYESQAFLTDRDWIDFFKAFFPEGKTAQYFIEHHGFGEGKAVVMNETQIREVFPATDWDYNPIDLSIPSAKMKKGSYDSGDVEAYAATGGTLGRTYVNVVGTIKEELINGKEIMVFRGTVNFKDSYDFNKDPTRSGIANDLTAVGRHFLPGKDFKITGDIEVVQYGNGSLEFVTGGLAKGKVSGMSEGTQDDNGGDHLINRF